MGAHILVVRGVAAPGAAHPGQKIAFICFILFAGSRFELRLRMFAGQMPPDEHAAVLVDDVTFE